MTAAYRIYQRALRLCISHDTPLAVFLTSRNTIRYIDHSMVEQTLKLLATQVYNITNKQELQRYTCHSLRVGACVLLHSSNASADTIKWRLRWKSDSYRMYLRDTAAIAQTHNLCVAYTDPDAANFTTAVHGPDLHLDLKRGFASFSSAPRSGPATAVL